MVRRMGASGSGPDDAAFTSDYQLAQRAAAGDRRAQRQVVMQLMDRSRNLACYIVRDAADAEDVAQHAMAEVLRAIGGYSGSGSLAKWADRIVARASWAHIKKRRKEAQVLRFGWEEAQQQGRGPAAAAGDPLLRSRLAHHLGRIKPARRAVLVMRLVGGMSLEQIASSCELPLNTVKDRLRVGRKELRKAILRDPALAELTRELLS